MLTDNCQVGVPFITGIYECAERVVNLASRSKSRHPINEHALVALGDLANFHGMNHRAPQDAQAVGKILP